jgi:hypothetical protein
LIKAGVLLKDDKQERAYTVCGETTVSERPAAIDRLLAIRHLAAWASRLGDTEDRRINAGVLKQLVSAARRHGKQAIEEFQDIARRSTELLPGLGEPLTVLDFGEHRWVGDRREEAFSDWLQWIVAQIEPAEVLRIFGVNDPNMVSVCSGRNHTCVRERCVPHGNVGAGGRLDLEIEFGDVALLVVEVKVGEAESSDTGKNAGYWKSVNEHHTKRLKSYVIVVLDAAEEEYYGFRPRLWCDVCVELRVLAARLCRRDERLRAAMILAFVGSVEQNLLKFHPVSQGATHTVADSLALPRITAHLSKFVEANAHG